MKIFSQEWCLADYEFEDGVGRYEYERETAGVFETHVVYRSQPTLPRHEGWKTRKVVVHPRLGLPA